MLQLTPQSKYLCPKNNFTLITQSTTYRRRGRGCCPTTIAIVTPWLSDVIQHVDTRNMVSVTIGRKAPACVLKRDVDQARIPCVHITNLLHFNTILLFMLFQNHFSTDFSDIIPPHIIIILWGMRAWAKLS